MFSEKESIITINQGDRIYHPGHGIGIVKYIREKSFFGEREAKFVKLYFKRNDLTWLVRADSLPDNIRRPMCAKQAKKTLDHLQRWQGKLSDKWKVRATAHQAVIDKGDPLGYAEVVKNLSVLKKQNALSAADRKHLKIGIEFLSEELGNALGKSNERVLQLIEKATSSKVGLA